MNKQDTREEIEVDIDCYRDEDNSDYLRVPIYRVHSWLNRQTEITKHECSPGAIDNMLNTIGELEEQVGKLTAERDQLKVKRDIREVLAENAKFWEDKRNQWKAEMETFWKDIGLSEHTDREQDTREKLEADIHKWTTCSWVTVSHEKVIDWLDRQAAITRNIERRMHDYILDNLERENDKLIAECNELKEQLRIEREAAGICNGCHYVDGVIAELTAERDEWKTKCETREIAYKQADAERKRYSEQIDELTAERDELRETINGIEHGQEMLDLRSHIHERDKQIAELTAERDELREALDACGTGTMYELWRRDHTQLKALRAALHDKSGT